MKIALVHELLTMRGGAERVLRILADMFPQAPIYTLLYNQKKLGDWFPKDRIRTGKFPAIYSLLPPALKYDHHLYLKHFPAAVEAWNFDEFDVVLSTSSAFTHGLLTNGQPKHLCYVHTPARYLWDRTHDVLQQAGKGPLGFLKRQHLERTFHKLRLWDAEVADRPDKLLAASGAIKRRIELYWRRDSQVLYPPIDDYWFAEDLDLNPKSQSYLIVSTLVTYKRIDLAVKACNKLKLPLQIVGEGPDKKRLQRLAGPTVEFLGYKPRETIRDLYQKAKAIIFPGDEDFGLVPLEAACQGTPVIAYRSGGALETIVENKTGVFFDEPTADSLAGILQNFKAEKFDPKECREQAMQFSKDKFEKGIKAAIEGLV